MADYATLLRDHVTLTCRSVDRIFLQAYVPRLQSVGGVCLFLYWQKGFGSPSSAAFGKFGDAYVAQVYRWAKANAIPVRRFAKGENKEAHVEGVADELLEKITQGVDPQISCYYRSSRIKQYFKEHRALRTETVICTTRDFGIGRRVTAENWKALWRLAMRPTSVCATRKQPMPGPLRMWPPSPR